HIPAYSHLLNRGRAIRRFVLRVSRALQGLAHHGAQFALVFDEQERFHLSRFYHESGFPHGTIDTHVRRREASHSANDPGPGSRKMSGHAGPAEFSSQRNKSLIAPLNAIRLCRTRRALDVRTNLDLKLPLKTSLTAPNRGPRQPFSNPSPYRPIAA